MSKQSNRIGDAPIESKYRELMQALGRGIDEILNGRDRSKKTSGFILMVFPFEGHEGRCNYMSNADRKDVVVMLKEQIARFEGSPDVKGSA